MQDLAYRAMQLVFGTTLLEDVASMLRDMLDAILVFFSESNVSAMLSIFKGVAVSLLIIYFFMELYNSAQREMLTLQKLIFCFIKLFVGVALLVYLQDILIYIVKIGDGLYGMLAEKAKSLSFNTNVELFGIDLGTHSFPELTDTVQNASGEKMTLAEAMSEGGFTDKASAAARNIGLLFKLGVVVFLTQVAKVAGYFVAISSAVLLCVQMIFSPIAVVQCFDEGSRSSGILYLKRFAATALVFAVILGCLYASSRLSSSFLVSALKDTAGAKGGVLKITTKNISSVLDGNAVIFLTAVQLATVGVILKGAQISREIIGA